MAPIIQNKDVIHVNRNEAVNNGDLVCLALKDHSEAMVRYYKQVTWCLDILNRQK